MLYRVSINHQSRVARRREPTTSRIMRVSHARLFIYQSDSHVSETIKQFSACDFLVFLFLSAHANLTVDWSRRSEFISLDAIFLVWFPVHAIMSFRCLDRECTIWLYKYFSQCGSKSTFKHHSGVNIINLHFISIILLTLCDNNTYYNIIGFFFLVSHLTYSTYNDFAILRFLYIQQWVIRILD